MNDFLMIFQNQILWVSLVSWITAQCLKVLLHLARERKLELRLLTAPGGMPSAHSATMMSLTVSVGMTYGWDSPLLAVAASVAMVVMYDAAGIRRAAGKQAATINRLIDRFTHGAPHERKQISPEELKEILGHTPLQVMMGALLGMLIAIFMN